MPIPSSALLEPRQHRLVVAFERPRLGFRRSGRDRTRLGHGLGCTATLAQFHFGPFLAYFFKSCATYTRPSSQSTSRPCPSDADWCPQSGFVSDSRLKAAIKESPPDQMAQSRMVRQLRHHFGARFFDRNPEPTLFDSNQLHGSRTTVGPGYHYFPPFPLLHHSHITPRAPWEMPCTAYLC